LAARDDVESRLVWRERSRWGLAQGPFRRADFRAMPKRNWTLLVQGLNLHLVAADALLRRLAFIPYARLDEDRKSVVEGAGGVRDWSSDVCSADLLAARDDVESRLVWRERSRWGLAQGPFRRADFRAMPKRNWTLLVQGLNLHLVAADALLRRFAFIPYARLD